MDCCGHEGPGGGDARFEIQKVADGVYAAVAEPAYKVNCNTTIIENDDGVMIVRHALEAVGGPGDHRAAARADP
jgi:hypothetical protein